MEKRLSTIKSSDRFEIVEQDKARLPIQNLTLHRWWQELYLNGSFDRRLNLCVRDWKGLARRRRAEAQRSPGKPDPAPRGGTPKSLGRKWKLKLNWILFEIGRETM